MVMTWQGFTSSPNKSYSFRFAGVWILRGAFDEAQPDRRRSSESLGVNVSGFDGVKRRDDDTFGKVTLFLGANMLSVILPGELTLGLPSPSFLPAARAKKKLRPLTIFCW